MNAYAKLNEQAPTEDELTATLENLLAQFEAAGGEYDVATPTPSFRLGTLGVTIEHDGTAKWSGDDDPGYRPERGSWAGRYAAYQARCKMRFEEAFSGIKDIIAVFIKVNEFIQ